MTAFSSIKLLILREPNSWIVLSLCSFQESVKGFQAVGISFERIDLCSPALRFSKLSISCAFMRYVATKVSRNLVRVVLTLEELLRRAAAVAERTRRGCEKKAGESTRVKLMLQDQWLWEPEYRAVPHLHISPKIYFFHFRHSRKSITSKLFCHSRRLSPALPPPAPARLHPSRLHPRLRRLHPHPCHLSQYPRRFRPRCFPLSANPLSPGPPGWITPPALWPTWPPVKTRTHALQNRRRRRRLPRPCSCDQNRCVPRSFSALLIVATAVYLCEGRGL